MNSVLKFLFAIAIITMFISCTRNDATSVSFSEQEVNLDVGQSDTIVVTMDYTGDASKIHVTVSASDTNVTSVSMLSAIKKSNIDELNFQCSIVVKAKSAGTDIITLSAGSFKSTLNATVTKTSLNITNAVVQNYGLAIETSDNYVYDMYFFPQTFNVDTANQSFRGLGKFIHIESYFPNPTDILPTGTYSINVNGNQDTCQPGFYYSQNGKSYPYGTYLGNVKSDTIEYSMIKSGTFTVSYPDNKYIINGEFITETGEIVDFNYSGQINVFDKKEKPEVVKTQFTKGDLRYFGDVYDMGISSTFFLFLETGNVNISADTLNGDVLLLQCNTAKDVTEYLPTGKYRMMTQAELSDYKVYPFSIVPGNFYYYQGNQYTGGSWYYDGFNSTRKKLISGEINVVYNESWNSYDITYSLYDRIGSLVTGSYSGHLSYAPMMWAPGYIKSDTNEQKNKILKLPFSNESENVLPYGHIRQLHFMKSK